MEHNLLKKITVIGGGTSGWISALMAKFAVPDAEVTVIESDVIGAIGAGEGTTPPLVQLFEILQIPISDIVAKTGATIKNGVKFTNFNGDGDYYHHNFVPLAENITVHHSNFLGGATFRKYNVYHAMDVMHDLHSKEANFHSLISEAGKTPFTVVNDKAITHALYAIHFDAQMLTKFLREVAIERGCIRIVGTITDQFDSDEEGNILAVNLTDGSKHDADFFFDCTGLARLIIGKHFKSEWVSHKDILTTNKALPFFLEMDDVFPPYSEGIAMKYGWMWRVPLQHRYGCGYVYDGNLCSDEDAKAEIEEMMKGKNITFPRDKPFYFEAGYYKETWIKNCIAIGLSTGFIEPMEATALWGTAIQLFYAFGNPYSLGTRSPMARDRFNDFASSFNRQNVDFIYFHYMGQRRDTEFWEKFHDLNNAPPFVKFLMNLWQEDMPGYEDPPNTPDKQFFNYENWWEVGYGLKRVNKDIVLATAKHNRLERFVEQYWQIKANQKYATSVCMTHKETIEQFKIEALKKELINETKEKLKGELND